MVAWLKTVCPRVFWLNANSHSAYWMKWTIHHLDESHQVENEWQIKYHDVVSYVNTPLNVEPFLRF